MISLQQYRTGLDNECRSILSWWMQHTIDEELGGFFGRIDNENKVIPGSPKGAVLNSRILYTFSSAYHHYKNPLYLQTAVRAFKYILHQFLDNKYGGIYWSVDAKGKPLDTKKQVYAVAFAIYGMSEYYMASGDEAALEAAIELYKNLEFYSHDKQKGGYLEAFDREWTMLDDLRLSEKDVNEKKTMNTHLHVLEAYSNLYKVWPVQQLKENIIELLKLFINHFIDAETGHLILFFNEEWQSKNELVSYGHDIEAAWLLQEAAQTINAVEILEEVKILSVKLANAAARGLDGDGGLWYEKVIAANQLIKEKHWWPQAEAMVGFFNAWTLTGDDNYLKRSTDSWLFINEHILDRTRGEWFWGVNEYNSIMPGEDKAGLWKCPYHNGRACLELLKRIPANTLL